MNVSLNRIILYVRNVQVLTTFYRDAFGLPVVEEIEDEWAVLRAGQCELALHRVGRAFRSDPRSPGSSSNAKLVMAVDADLTALRQKLIANGVAMGEITSYAGFTGPLCDGTDPEGNVFQLAQA